MHNRHIVAECLQIPLFWFILVSGNYVIGLTPHRQSMNDIQFIIYRLSIIPALALYGGGSKAFPLTFLVNIGK